MDLQDFLRTRSTVYSDVFGRPNPFLLHKQPSFLFFCAISKSALLLATVLRTPSHMYAAQPCSTVIENTQTHQTPFSSSEGHLYICKDKNIKHQILTWLKTCCQNENKFEREFAEISAC